MVGRVVDVPEEPSGTVLDDGRIVVELYVSGTSDNDIIKVENTDHLCAANFLLRHKGYFVRLYQIEEEKDAIVLKVGDTVIEGPDGIIKFVRNGEKRSPVPRHLRSSRDFGRCEQPDSFSGPALIERCSATRRR
ncbi:MAG: hypothetical protein ACHQX1_00545 [Candidatus Micrarchaeales archaeon]